MSLLTSLQPMLLTVYMNVETAPPTLDRPAPLQKAKKKESGYHPISKNVNQYVLPEWVAISKWKNESMKVLSMVPEL